MGLDSRDDGFFFISSQVRYENETRTRRRVIQIGHEFFQVGGFEGVNLFNDYQTFLRHEREGLGKVHDIGRGCVTAVEHVKIEIPGTRFYYCIDNEIERLLDQELLFAVKQIERRNLALLEAG